MAGDLQSISGTSGHLIGNRALACMLHNRNSMEFFCRHCDEIATGKIYRVFSEEDGLILLNMVVCRSCYDQARQLGLDGEEIKLDQNSHGQLPLVRSISDATHDQ
jgi:hypothetical protein